MHRLTPALITLAAWGALSAGAALAAPQLSPLSATLELDSAWHTDSDALSLTFTLTNDGRSRARVLDWQTPLTAVDKSLFVVTRDGEPVPYIWRIVDYGTPRLEHFLTLEPGAERSAVIPNLAALYDMSEPGLYEVRYVAPVLQGALGQDADLERLSGGLMGSLVSNSVSFWWEGSEAPAMGRGPSATVDSYKACRPNRRAELEEALENAAMIADLGVDHLDANGTGSDLYEFWFGDYNLARFNTVSGNFDAIADALNNEPIGFDCACKSPAYAYVYPTDPYNIHLCSAFWRAPMLGRDSKAGTLVHEMSHFNIVAGTDDIVYGASGAHNLAVTSPSQAIRNADNHEYFAEDQVD